MNGRSQAGKVTKSKPWTDKETQSLQILLKQCGGFNCKTDIKLLKFELSSIFADRTESAMYSHANDNRYFNLPGIWCGDLDKLLKSEFKTSKTAIDIRDIDKFRLSYQSLCIDKTPRELLMRAETLGVPIVRPPWQIDKGQETVAVPIAIEISDKIKVGRKFAELGTGSHSQVGSPVSSAADTTVRIYTTNTTDDNTGSTRATWTPRCTRKEENADALSD